MSFGFVIDNRKCIGCHACTVACKSEHQTPIGVNRTWVKYVEKGIFPNTRRLFSVMRCNHCQDAPCVDICPVSALFHRTDGIVDFDNERCIGCKACTQACPYDALYIDPESHTAAKCNYCAHRVDVGLEPACVNVCPEHAIISGDMDDPSTEIAQLLGREQVSVRKAEKGTRPNLFYIEADQTSLEPSLAAPSSSTVWGSQSGGVGHFSRTDGSALEESQPSESQAKSESMNWLKDWKGRPQVLAPDASPSMVAKAEEVQREEARRVYDAPSKGLLWGWEVGAYLWTKSISTGAVLILFLLLALTGQAVPKPAQLAAVLIGLVFIALTGALLVRDLDRPERFLYVLLRPQWKSWLVRGAYGILLFSTLLLLWVASHLWQLEFLGVLLLWPGILLATFTAIYTAFLFAQAKGRDFWQSPTLVLHMLVHALMAGASVFPLTLLFIETDWPWETVFAGLLSGSLGAHLVLLFVELVTPHPTEDARQTVRSIVAGAFRVRFWVGVVFLGALLPLALVWTGFAVALALASALTLAGLFWNEQIWVEAPQRIPLS